MTTIDSIAPSAPKQRRTRRRWIPQQRAQWVALFEKSGQSVLRFCRDHDLRAATLSLWRAQRRRSGEGGKVVSSSKGALRPAARAALKPGEVAATGEAGTHAEVNGVNGAKAAGLTPTGTAASRPICPDCAAKLNAQGVAPLSPLKSAPAKPICTGSRIPGVGC
jgi:transposase-like protein